MSKRTIGRAPNEDSNHQPAHQRSLIRVFVVRMKKLSLAIKNSPSEDSDQAA